MLEETLIRESSTNKLQGRGFGAPTPQNKSSVGPPVTFMNPSQKSPASKDDSSAAEKTVSAGSLQDMLSGDLNEEVNSPAEFKQERRGKSGTMVKQPSA